jgi:hypothetical protein
MTNCELHDHDFLHAHEQGERRVLMVLGLTIITFPIGVVVGEVVMMAIYFAVFLPIGMIFRLMRRDALERGIDKSAPTYWQPKKQPAKVDSYFRQW